MSKAEPYLESIGLDRGRVPSFARYPFSIPAIRNLSSLELHPEVTFFIGENGTGKSTLLEGIAVLEGFNAEGGTRNYRFATRESHDPDLPRCLGVRRGPRGKLRRDGFFLRAESFYNVSSYAESISADLGGERSAHQLSHGEAFLSLIANRLTGGGLYLFDEPEAALSPQRQLALLVRMHELVLADSQFIIATHSPIIMAYPGAWIYEFSDNGIKRVDYRDTEHYRVTHAFMNRTDKMLAELLSGE